MMNCQLPDDQLAGIEAQLVAANNIHHLSGLLCLQFDEQAQSYIAWHGATSLSWGKSWAPLCHTALHARLRKTVVVRRHKC